MLGNNITDYIAFATEENQSKSQSFYLINDVTSFVHLGDFLIKDKEHLSICEWKAGHMNQSLLARLNASSDKDAEVKTIASELGYKAAAQAARILRQQIRNINTVELLNKGVGTDSEGDKVVIHTERIVIEHFCGEVQASICESDRRGWGIRVIDDCLLFAAYQGEFRPSAHIQNLGRRRRR